MYVRRMNLGCTADAGVPGACGDLLEALSGLSACDVGALSPREMVAALESLQRVRNALPAVEHRLLAALQRQSTPAELGDAPTWAVWLRDLLLLSSAEARRRVDHATALGPRTSLTGQPLGPELPATAAAQADGLITEAHVAVMADFAARIPTASTRRRSPRPKPTSPSWPRRSRPKNYAPWSPNSSTAGTKMVSSATPTAPRNAASSSAGKARTA